MSIPTSIIASVLDPDVKRFLEEARNRGSAAIQGIGCTNIGESLPTYQPAQCERVYSGKNNTYIVLGRDRPGTEFSGCGGRGDTQCGMIDLVAGRISSTIMNNLKRATSGTPTVGQTSGIIDSNIVVDNNFFADAARVYITQRAINIDDYLGFKNERGSDPTELSAAVIKSDCTRIVGRESVRIYAGGAKADGFGSFGEPRADGSDIDKPRIELIVGNQGEDNMQPAVMGRNLISYLKTNNEINNKLLKIFLSLIKQVTINTAALVPLTFGAMGTVAGANAAENIENLSNIYFKLINEAINDVNHLDEAIIPGSKSILSNKVFIT